MAKRKAKQPKKRKAKKPARRKPMKKKLTKKRRGSRRTIAAVPRKEMGGGIFARVVPFTPAEREDLLGPVPMVSKESDEDVRAQSVFDELSRGAIDVSDAAELAALDPNGSYVMILIVRGGSGREQSREKGQQLATDERRIVYVGRGERLQYLAMYHAHEDGEIVSVEVKEAKQPAKAGRAFPLWTDQVVELAGGGVIAGSGNRALWEANRADAGKKKGGRKKKGGGGMTAPERKRSKARNAAAKRRHDTSEAKIAALKAAGRDAEARKLRVRVEAQRAAAIRKKATRAVFARAKVKKKRGKRRGKRR